MSPNMERAEWKKMLTEVYLLFDEEEQEDDSEMKELRQLKKITKKDERFTNLFMKAKAYSLIINFLKLSAKVKIEAAANVLKGNERLGLHAVTFSRELLKVIELCNYILSIFCQDCIKSKK